MEIPSRRDPSDPVTFCQTVFTTWLSREPSEIFSEDEVAKSSLICQPSFLPRIVPDKLWNMGG